MQAVVQGGVLSQPWKEFLDVLVGLPPKTMAEAIVGRTTLLQKKLDETNSGWREMMHWGSFDEEMQGMATSADALTLFRLQEFTLLNERLVNAMQTWGIKGVRAAAAVMEDDKEKFIRVRAITSAGSVDFDEAYCVDVFNHFPSEELLTKLQMINT